MTRKPTTESQRLNLIRIADRHGDLKLVAIIVEEVEARAVCDVGQVDDIAERIDRVHRQRFGYCGKRILIDQAVIVALARIAAQFTRADGCKIERLPVVRVFDLE